MATQQVFTGPLLKLCDMDLSGAHRNNRGRNQSGPLYERLPTKSQKKEKEIKNQCEGSSGTTLSTEEVIMQPTPRKVRILPFYRCSDPVWDV